MFNKKKDENKSENTNPFASDNLDMDDTSTEENNGEKEATSENENIKEEVKEEKNTQNNEEFEQLKSQYVRLAADFDNFRKRQAQERESLLKYGAESTLKLLLPILDTYERGKKACEEMTDPNQLRENFDVMFKQLFAALNKAGLKRIETVGREFDPNLHEAVMQTQTSEQPENSIVAELQAGYMLEDKVLRAAMVNVAVGE